MDHEFIFYLVMFFFLLGAYYLGSMGRTQYIPVSSFKDMCEQRGGTYHALDDFHKVNYKCIQEEKEINL